MKIVRKTLILQLLGTVLFNKAVVGRLVDVASREAGAKCIHQSSQREGPQHHCSKAIDQNWWTNWICKTMINETCSITIQFAKSYEVSVFKVLQRRYLTRKGGPYDIKLIQLDFSDNTTQEVFLYTCGGGGGVVLPGVYFHLLFQI